MSNRNGLGFVDPATAVAGAKAAQGFVKQIQGLFGGGYTAADKARDAITASMTVGALAGIVDSARLLLGRSQENQPKTVKEGAKKGINQVQALRPDVWQLASEAGPLHDQYIPGGTDGRLALKLLADAGIGFDMPYMGTDDAKAVQPAVAPIVAELKQLSQKGASSTGYIKPGEVVGADEGGGSHVGAQLAGFGTSPAMLAAIAGALIFVATRPKR